MTTPLISIRDLKVHFDLGGGRPLDKLIGTNTVKRVVKAVDGVSLEIYERETLGLVGESGCGKSTLGRAILRLTEPTDGQVFYRDRDLAHLSSRHFASREEGKLSNACRSCWRQLASANVSSRDTRTSFPAVSDNASASLEHLQSILISSLRTSRSQR